MLLASMGLLSCTKDVTLFADAFWLSTELSREKRTQLSKFLGEARLRLRVVEVTDPFSEQSVTNHIGSTTSETILLSPILTPYASLAAEALPQKRVVGMSLSPQSESPFANVAMLNTDRRKAYFNAGELCGRMIYADDDRETQGVGIFYTGGRERIAERESFLAGFATIDQDDRFVVLSYPRFDTIRDITVKLNELANRNIGVFMVSMAALNEEVIKAISSQFAGEIITERYAGSGASASRIVASVEDPWARGIVSLIAGSDKAATIDAELHPGPAADDTIRELILRKESR